MRNVLLIASLAATALLAPFAAAQRAPVASKQSFDQLLQAAEKARDENRDEEAIRLYRRALAQQPESEQGLWFLGTLLYEKKQYPEARDVLRQFMTLRPDAGPGWAMLGLSEFQTRDYRRALDHLQHAMAAGMGDREELVQAVFKDVAVLLTRFERYDDSLDLLLKMLDTNAQQPDLIEPAGLAGLRLPFLPAEIPPDHRELVGLAGRAVLALQTRHNEEAESEFRRLVTAYPNEPGVHFLYGAYLMESHPNEAVPELERELEISPTHVLARIRLAEALIAQRKFDRALALAQQAIQLEPKRASAHMMAGEALVAKGQPGDGIKELEIARAANPAVSRTHWDLLRAYTAVGRKEDAEQEKKEIEKLPHSN
jgi:tetratricopeptide (TPR) repeat protein